MTRPAASRWRHCGGDNGGVRALLSPPRPLSWSGVRRQSTLVAVAVVGVALVAGTSLLLALLHSSLNDALRESLTTRAAQVARTIEVGGPHGLERSEEVAQLPPEQELQVLDEAGELVFSSRRTQTVLTGLRPAPGQWLSEGESAGVLPPDEPLTVAVGARSEQLGSPARRYVVAVTSSQSALRHAIVSTGTMIAVAMPFLLVLAGAATWWLTGRALRPVEEIRREVAGIDYGDLAARVPVPASRDEVAALAETMNDMLARLESSAATQRRFVADASHELRSPIATLAASIELGDRDPGSRPELAGLMAGEVARLSRLVDDLLLLAKADDRGLVVRRHAVDLDDLVTREAARLRAHGRVQVRLDAPPLQVSGDADRLAQVMRNLCDNAERAARGVVALTVRRQGEEAVVTVDDDGPGIARPDRERVFGRFVRLDDARARSAGGSGLGLAIVAEVVGAHGGTVRVVPGDLPGARFEVRLPL